jgi:hypothetical protein
MPKHPIHDRAYYYDDEISLQPLIWTLWGYRRLIAAAVSGIVILYALVALVAYLRQPVERHVSVEFRLLFDGADRGEYPSGLRFSPAEIISTPILSEVYGANQIERYTTFEEFKGAIFVLESNKDLDLLSYEYQTRLADSRLSPVDRARFEDEFRQKREALRQAQYTINFLAPNRGRVPPMLMSKTLDDILSRWAEDAALRKGALQYQVPVLTPNVLQRNFIATEDYIVRLDVLRGKIIRILENLDQLAALPGGAVARVSENRISLGELRANLEDILRYRLQPLVGLIRTTGLSQDHRLLLRYLEDRLFQIRLDQREAQAKLIALRDALRAYTVERPAPAAGPEGQGSQALIPQVGETFLDRLISLAGQNNNDVEYRQTLTDRIIEAGQASVSLEKEATYYEEMMASVRGLPPSAASRQADAAPLELIDRQFDEIYQAVVGTLEQAQVLYEEISTQNLNPRTHLYGITHPSSMRMERALTISTLALYSLLVFLVSLVVVPLFCLIHHFLVHPGVGQPPRPPAEPSLPAEERSVDRRPVGV